MTTNARSTKHWVVTLVILLVACQSQTSESDAAADALLDAVHLPSGFTRTDSRLSVSGEAIAIYEGPANTPLDRASLGLPDGYQQLVPKRHVTSATWRTIATYEGPSPTGDGTCRISFEVAHDKSSSTEVQLAANCE